MVDVNILKFDFLN